MTVAEGTSPDELEDLRPSLGENIGTAEVEALVRHHPSVTDLA